jgi:hypothetical protein
MAVMLLVPWMGFHPGDVVDRGEPLDLKLVRLGLGERVTVVRDAVEKAVIRPKEKRDVNSK